MRTVNRLPKELIFGGFQLDKAGAMWPRILILLGVGG